MPFGYLILTTVGTYGLGLWVLHIWKKGNGRG